MYNKYKKQVDQQHAPEELISDTLKKLEKELEKDQKEDEKKVISFPKKWVALAASLLILIGGVYGGTRLLQKPQEMTFAKVEQDLNSDTLKFGAKQTDRKIKIITTSEGKSFPVEIYENPSENVDKYKTEAAWDIKGTEVYLAEDSASYYGCYVRSSEQYLVKAERSSEMNQDEFIKVLEAILGENK